MHKVQKGSIIEINGRFYSRYWTTELVNGAAKRVQRTKVLCAKDAEHDSTAAPAVKLLHDAAMLEVNQLHARPGSPLAQLTVAQFWEQTYLPHIKENLRAATVHGYTQIWNTHLREHFGSTKLVNYRVPMATAFLTQLGRIMGRKALHHVRAVASSIFSHAMAIGHIETNPWHFAKGLTRAKKDRPTGHYTLADIGAMIEALAGRLDCQLLIALSFYAGLRPSEIIGLQWQDVDPEGYIHVRRAVVYRVLGETKTPEAAAPVPLVAQLKAMLTTWYMLCGKPAADQWILPGIKGKPLDYHNCVHRIIKPTLAKNKLTWRGLYAGRRGAGTVLTELTGSAIAAQQILRHKNLAVTTAAYVKQMPTAGIAGMKLLEAAAGKK